MSVGLAVILVAPLLPAGSAAFAVDRGTRGVVAVLAAGVVLAALVALAAYLRAPTDHAPSGCSDCGNFGGRWLDPAAVLFVVVLGFGGWAAGTAGGAVLRRLVRLRRHRTGSWAGVVE